MNTQGYHPFNDIMLRYAEAAYKNKDWDNAIVVCKNHDFRPSALNRSLRSLHAFSPRASCGNIRRSLLY